MYIWCLITLRAVLNSCGSYRVNSFNRFKTHFLSRWYGNEQLDICMGSADLKRKIFSPNVRKQQENCDTVLKAVITQGHPADCFGRISVRKTCNRLKFSVREMSSRAFLIKIN